MIRRNAAPQPLPAPGCSSKTWGHLLRGPPSGWSRVSASSEALAGGYPVAPPSKRRTPSTESPKPGTLGIVSETSNEEESTRQRFRGCLLGGALGDALGYPIEFDSATAIGQRYGATAPQRLAYAGPALVSDDTQMTLFAAEGLLRSVSRFSDRGVVSIETLTMHSLLRWLSTQEPSLSVHTPFPEASRLLADRRLHASRAPGHTNLSALKAALRDGKLPTPRRPRNDSKGCGAVMRSAPAGLIAGSPARAFEIGRDTGVLTHGHPSGYLSAGAFAAIVNELSRGRALTAAVQRAQELLDQEEGGEETQRAIEGACELADRGTPTISDLEGLGGGWVGEEALAIALACVLTAETDDPAGVAEALWRSVAHGGDSDSTGSLAGNLLGAMVGERGLPQGWVEEVELRDRLVEFADDLYSAAILDETPDFRRYPPG